MMQGIIGALLLVVPFAVFCAYVAWDLHVANREHGRVMPHGLTGMGLDVDPKPHRKIKVSDERYFWRIRTQHMNGKYGMIRTVYCRIPAEHTVQLLRILQAARITPASEEYR